jgi:hypothetical protein
MSMHGGHTPSGSVQPAPERARASVWHIGLAQALLCTAVPASCDVRYRRKLGCLRTNYVLSARPSLCSYAGNISCPRIQGCCAVQVVTGQGIIGQVQQWTGLSEMAVVALLTGLVGINAVGGLWPNGPTFSEQNQRVSPCLGDL